MNHEPIFLLAALVTIAEGLVLLVKTIARVVHWFKPGEGKHRRR